jgi:hypothetical protein
MHIHSLTRAALAACVLAATAATPAMAAPVTAKLRVEAGGKALDRGFRYVTDTATFATATTPACGGSGESKTVEGPTALGLLFDGAGYNARLRPVEVSDQFEFGLFVCGVGGYQSGESFWGLRVNHAEAQVGGDQITLQPNDEVLWTHITFNGANSGSELVLEATDHTVEVGEPLQLRVLAYDAEGTATPAGGVTLADGVTTDAEGRAEVVYDAGSRPVFRGTRGNDIPTEPERFCIWEVAESDCADFTRERTVGTERPDTVAGIAVPEYILGRAGNDTIRSRGGGEDIVRCGPGRDLVRADRRDSVGRDCERVVRK